MKTARIFPPYFNVIARYSLAGAFVLVGLLGWGWYGFLRSEFVTLTNYPLEQPIQFSHQHHVNRLGLDCRYCHTSVERSSFAGMPPTYTCMTCHSQIWNKTAMLAPVRQSFQTRQPLEWTRVYDLPDYVYFNHSIHVAKGFGCATCHGRVDKMPLTALAQPLFMRWCLECHQNPERYVRPRDKVFEMEYQPSDQLKLGPALVRQYQIRKLIDCSVCHR